ncbi:hypothetical protein [Mycobacterium cookii]|uniref:hypothetical protein n=1 Tax=Mycobacterium cookii TaxID=1775 RepID=UPI003FD8E4F1
MARVRAEDGRSGIGWIEWNRNQARACRPSPINSGMTAIDCATTQFTHHAGFALGYSANSA